LGGLTVSIFLQDIVLYAAIFHDFSFEKSLRWWTRTQREGDIFCTFSESLPLPGQRVIPTFVSPFKLSARRIKEPTCKGRLPEKIAARK
jgi:hypothetical protein